MDNETRMKLLETKVDYLVDWAKQFEENSKLKREENWLTTPQAAKQLNLSLGTLLNQIREGKIKAIKTCPESSRSRYKVSEAEVIRILQKRGTNL